MAHVSGPGERTKQPVRLVQPIPDENGRGTERSQGSRGSPQQLGASALG